MKMHENKSSNHTTYVNLGVAYLNIGIQKSIKNLKNQ